jgi:hypothetical protein
MKRMLLLPHRFRLIGCILLLVSLALIFADVDFSFLKTSPHKTSGIFNLTNDNLTDEFEFAGVLISLFMIAFSKQKVEDEYVNEVRLRSLMISVYVNYAILLVSVFLVYGIVSFMGILLYNVFTVLILFILIFQYNIYLRPRLFKTAKA